MTARPNNNPKDRQSLLDFQRRQLELDGETKMRAKQEIIKGNISNWRERLPKSLLNALPENLDKDTQEKIRNSNLQPPFTKRILISGKSSPVMSFVSHSILHWLLKMGIVTPSQIKRTSVLDGYNNINGMFTSRKWKDDFFSSNAKVLVIEGCSKALTYLGPKGEDQFWKELDDFTRNNDILVIMNYTRDDSESKAFIPALVNENDYNKSLVFKSTFINLTEKEENYIESKQGKTD